MGEYNPQSQYETGYFCELFDGTEFRVGKHIDIGYEELGSIDYPYDPDEWYYMRLRTEGNEIKAKVWAEGEEEPEEWDIEVTDDNWEEGLTGIGNFNHQGDRYYDFIGIGWLGNPAPKGDFAL